jgi:hypothetical protein
MLRLGSRALRERSVSPRLKRTGVGDDDPTIVEPVGGLRGACHSTSAGRPALLEFALPRAFQRCAKTDSRRAPGQAGQRQQDSEQLTHGFLPSFRGEISVPAASAYEAVHRSKRRRGPLTRCSIGSSNVADGTLRASSASPAGSSGAFAREPCTYPIALAMPQARFAGPTSLGLRLASLRSSTRTEFCRSFRVERRAVGDDRRVTARADYYSLQIFRS